MLLWQITNQSLNVAINSSNANKSTPMATSAMVKSYLLAVSASCSVALGLNALLPRMKRLTPGTRIVLSRLIPFAAVASAGALNVFLMRGEEIKKGIDVYPSWSADGESLKEQDSSETTSLGKSRKAALLAVSETALSRVLNATPIMVLPPLILVRLQRSDWLKQRPKLILPVNLGKCLVSYMAHRSLCSCRTCAALILTTSLFALPLALGAFPQRQAVRASSLEEEFWDKGGQDGKVEFNRGI